MGTFKSEAENVDEDILKLGHGYVLHKRRSLCNTLKSDILSFSDCRIKQHTFLFTLSYVVPHP